MQKILRHRSGKEVHRAYLWGLTAQRSWARLVLGCLVAVVPGSAAPEHINALPVVSMIDDAAEHSEFFLPDHYGHGATNGANEAPFGWRVNNA